MLLLALHACGRYLLTARTPLIFVICILNFGFLLLLLLLQPLVWSMFSPLLFGHQNSGPRRFFGSDSSSFCVEICLYTHIHTHLSCVCVCVVVVYQTGHFFRCLDLVLTHNSWPRFWYQIFRWFFLVIELFFRLMKSTAPLSTWWFILAFILFWFVVSHWPTSPFQLLIIHRLLTFDISPICLSSYCPKISTHTHTPPPSSSLLIFSSLHIDLVRSFLHSCGFLRRLPIRLHRSSSAMTNHSSLPSFLLLI